MPLWGNTDTIESRPKFVNLASEAPGSRLIFVDREEAQTITAKSKGIRGAGWYLFKEFVNSSGANRYRSELLVAMDVDPAISGDDITDDDVAPSHMSTPEPE